MPLRNLDQVQAGVHMLAGRTLKRTAKDYGERTIGPLVEVLKRANGFEDLQSQMSQSLFTRMDHQVVAGAIARTGVQAALIGRTAAIPVKKATGNRQQATGK